MPALPFDLPPVPTGKKRIVFSFGVNDNEYFKCFSSDEFLGTRYDRNPAQLLIKWDLFLRPYHCELQIFNPRNQLLTSFPIPKSVNTPYTIVDGMINEWITKEEFVTFQFVFTGNNGEFVKSTLPLRMNLSAANKPDYLKVVRPVDFDRMKEVYDNSIVNAVMRFDENSGWVYDFFSADGTLKFTLDWIPKDVVRSTEQLLTKNEKMVARSNINVPFTFTLPLTVSDGTSVTKSTTTFVNKLEEVTFDVWKQVGEDSFESVNTLSRSYNATSVSVELGEAIDGYIRVSCKSRRFIPSDEGFLIGSGFSGNLVMNEDWQTAIVGEETNE